MRRKYLLEIVYLAIVIVVSLVGFSSLYTGEQSGPNAYQYLHIATSLVWLLLMMGQLVIVNQNRFQLHRTIGVSVFVVGPILVAALSLLTVHSAAKDAIVGKADTLVVQNVMVAVEVALLILLAFLMRRNREVHGSLLLSSSLLFLGIALFFTFISYVPRYRIEGPETFSRFGDAAQAAAIVGSAIGLLFFLRNRRTGWPWLLVSAFFFLNGFLQGWVAGTGRTGPLTMLVASIGRTPGFVLGLLGFAALLLLAWRIAPARPRRRETFPTASAA